LDIHPIAAQVRAWRQRRGMTQQLFADALGRHVTWVKKFEAGDRQADPRISILEDIARVLDVPLAALLHVHSPAMASRQDRDTAAGTLRMALLLPVRRDYQADSALIGRRIAHGYHAYQASDYQALGKQLPGLIADTRAAVHASPHDRAARHALAEACHLSAITLMKLGDADAAWHAADRALATADTLMEPVTTALCAQALSWAATGTGQSSAGTAIAQEALQRYGAELAKRGEEGWTAMGMIQLKAAVAAAESRDPGLARDMIAAARSSAGHVRPDANARCTGFNTTNVLLYESSVHAQFADHAAALSTAARIHPAAFDQLPRERRTHHLVDMAGSALAAGRAGLGLEMLLRAEQISPQEVRSLPAARTVITGLVQTRRGPASQRELRELARRAEVAG
jgi:transcriptional regulator with XRE-family HTH domain